MEHFVFHLILETVQAIDRRLQKPLSRLIPDLSRLKAEPAEYLRQATVTIGPRRRHALSAVFGIVAGIAVVLGLFFTFKHFGPRQKGLDAAQIAGVIVSFVVTCFVVWTISLRWMRGGHLTLVAAGAELLFGNRSVFLPWDLFYTTGAAFEPDHKIVVLPVNPWVPVAVSDDAGEVQALLLENLEVPQVECSEFGQLTIKDLYEARIGELGELLRELGLRLGTGQLVGAEVVGRASPLAVPEAKGWYSIHLTQLPFPPICAGCGSFTPSVLEIGVTGENRSFKVPVPICESCLSKRSRRRWIWGMSFAVAGMFVGLAAAWLLLAGMKPGPIAVIGTMIGLAVAIMFAAIAQIIARDANTPVALKDYKPDKGIVKMRFRSSKLSAPLLEAMGVAEPVEKSEKVEAANLISK